MAEGITIYCPNIIVTDHFRRDVQEKWSEYSDSQRHSSGDPKECEAQDREMFDKGLNPQYLRDVQHEGRADLAIEHFVQAVKDGIEYLAKDSQLNHFGRITDLILLGPMLHDELGEWEGIDWQSSIFFFSVPSILPIRISRKKDGAKQELLRQLETGWKMIADDHNVRRTDELAHDHLDPFSRTTMTLKRLVREWEFMRKNNFSGDSPFLGKVKPELDKFLKEVESFSTPREDKSKS